MERLSEVQQNLGAVQAALSRLATRDYVDEQVRLVNQRIQEGKPTTQLMQFAKVATAITAIVAFFGLAYELATVLKDLRAVAQVVKKP